MTTPTRSTHTPGRIIARRAVSGHWLLTDDDTGAEMGRLDKSLPGPTYAAAPDLLALVRDLSEGASYVQCYQRARALLASLALDTPTLDPRD